MSLTNKTTSRIIERDMFGALLGTLVGVLVCRLLLLTVELPPPLLVLIIVLGSVTGAWLAHLRLGNLDLRQVGLRVMLWLIGAAAVLGVMSVLTATYGLLGRLAGTAAATACAAGLLWFFSVLGDREKYRGLAIFGAASSIVAFMLTMPGIWSLGPEEMTVTGVMITLMLPFGLAALQLLQSSQTKISGLVGTVLFVIVMIFFTIGIWETSQRYSDECLSTGLVLAAYGIVVVAQLVGMHAGYRHYWRWLGVASAGVACLLVIWGIWSNEIVSERVITVISAVAIGIAHANLLLQVPIKSSHVWLRTATVYGIAFTVLFLDIDLLGQLSTSEISLVGRAALATGILASCGTFALVTLAVLNRLSQTRLEAGPIESVTVYCPGCGKRQQISLESASCVSCGLVVEIRVRSSEGAPAKENEPPFPAQHAQQTEDAGEDAGRPGNGHETPSPE